VAKLTAFDGQDVAELECPLGGHSSQRAAGMILGVVGDGKPPLCCHGGELLRHRDQEVPAEVLGDPRHAADEGDRTIEVGLAEQRWRSAWTCPGLVPCLGLCAAGWPLARRLRPRSKLASLGAGGATTDAGCAVAARHWAITPDGRRRHASSKTRRMGHYLEGTCCRSMGTDEARGLPSGGSHRERKGVKYMKLGTRAWWSARSEARANTQYRIPAALATSRPGLGYRPRCVPATHGADGSRRAHGQAFARSPSASDHRHPAKAAGPSSCPA
jgi:hypothetical protein